MKERVFLSNNQDGMIENYRMMHFLNVTDVLTNRINCSGSTFNLTLFWRVVRDLHALWIEFTSPLIHLPAVHRRRRGSRRRHKPWRIAHLASQSSPCLKKLQRQLAIITLFTMSEKITKITRNHYRNQHIWKINKVILKQCLFLFEIFM